jgi:hypothetical protein
MVPLLRVCALALLASPALAQGSPSAKGPLHESPSEIRTLMQKHMVAKPLATVERHFRLTAVERDKVLEILELHTCTAYQRYLREVRQGQPGWVGKKLDAQRKRHQTGAVPALSQRERTGFEYLPVTVVAAILEALPSAQLPDLLDRLDPHRRDQLKKLAGQRVLVFKKLAPAMRLPRLGRGPGRGKGKGKAKGIGKGKGKGRGRG